MRQGRGVDQVKTAFLDSDYLHNWDGFVFTLGANAALRDLQTAGFMLIGMTNQAGIARGYLST